ncbi:MAG TPA: single-stranded DNA-binding protein [Clostridiales bacterium]|nr:single-stranded DNA-binding protein [Clostridiales bacterium]
MLNVVVLTGRLTETPELRHTPNGVPVTRFAVAVQRAFKSADGDYETDFINIVAWRSQAEFITRFFTKGQEIGIQGSIQTRRYTDKDGNKRTAFEVIVDRAHFVGPKHTADSQDVEPPVSFSNADTGDFAEITDDDDLPF